MKTYLKYCLAVAVLASAPVAASAGTLDCTGCHAEKSDIRPLDAPYRNMSSGAFLGNHRTHVGSGSTFNSCVACHGNDGYAPGHMDGRIQLSAKINSYSGLAGRSVYATARPAERGADLIFFNQTSIPVLASCSKVNCHFEATTPVWGSPAFSTYSQCNQCHGSSTPLTSSHALHGRYSTGLMGSFSIYAACASCHSDYASTPSFSHATSAGKRPIDVRVGGYFSGSLTYLPSQSHGAFGSCSNLYCHSPGTKAAAPFTPPGQIPSWNGSLRADCSACHAGGASSATRMASGSHARHVYSLKQIDCVVCHGKTVNPGLVVKDLASHVNGLVDIGFNATEMVLNGRYNGSENGVAKTPGSPFGTCDNLYCHSNAQNEGGTGITYKQPTWGKSASGSCGQCHDIDAGHGGSKEIASGSHTKHLAYNSMTLSEPVKCTQCHNLGGEPFNPNCATQCHTLGKFSVPKHVNHQIEVSIPSYFGAVAAYNGPPDPGNGYSNCSAVYCHSDGTSLATGIITALATPVWGSGEIPCSGCHQYPPSYPHGSPKANSHGSHASFGCNLCHAGTTTDGSSISGFTMHVNKTYDLQPAPGVTFNYVFAETGGTCSNISCHNGNSATWGSTLSCGNCHVTSPGD